MQYFGTGALEAAGLVVRAAYFAGEKHRLQRRSDVE